MSFRSNDYECPTHGRFDVTVPREEDENPQPCPVCDEPSPWRFPAPMGRMEFVTVVRGRGEGPRSKRDLDTRPLADGQSLSDFRASRRKMWQEERRARVRAAL